VYLGVRIQRSPWRRPREIVGVRGGVDPAASVVGRGARFGRRFALFGLTRRVVDGVGVGVPSSRASASSDRWRSWSASTECASV